MVSVTKQLLGVLLIHLCITLFFIAPATAMPDIKNLADIKIITNEQNNEFIGLDITLKEHWKTYWKIPGDAGLPPQLDWTSSTNIDGTPEIIWPIPTRFEKYGIQNIGYMGQTIFPIKIKPINPSEPISISLKVNLLLCDEICVPFEQSFTKTLPAKNNKSSEIPSDFQAYLPLPDENVSLQNIIVIENEEPILSMTLFLPNGYNANDIDDIFIYTNEGLFFDTPKTTVKTITKGLLLTANIPLRIPLDDEYKLQNILEQDDNFSVILSFKNRDSILIKPDKSKKIVTIQETKESPNNSIEKTLMIFLIFAFIGGLILNIMPCVLPVLSLKFLSMIKSSDKSKKHIRIGFLASAFGILCAFWSIAGFISILKLGGHSIGWGMQFQHTGFLIFLSILIFLFSLNLWGVFEIQIPKFITKIIPTNKHHDHDSILGNFLTGVLATLLATPCSAPFLGTAVGFALAQNTAIIFLIFTFLGLGLAFPYILIAIFPIIAQYMPRPGAWMLTVKKVMGVALLLTALWLGNIALQNIIGRQDDNYNTKTAWQNLNIEQIKEAVSQNKIVFVDITADWCLTCKVNKKLVLDDIEIQKLLLQKNTILMRGDWTQMNDKITEYINSFNRYGIPLNVIYGAKYPNGITLPELLSKNTVKQYFKKVQD